MTVLAKLNYQHLCYHGHTNYSSCNRHGHPHILTILVADSTDTYLWPFAVCINKVPLYMLLFGYLLHSEF